MIDINPPLPDDGSTPMFSLELKAMERIEAKLIRDGLQEAEGRLILAAVLLGIPPTSLSERIVRFRMRSLLSE